ncbi:MAG: hypothetical protein LN413_01285 [Candidatus Thermoplasmatota archaeon]|nr:hypothetical protein [Candidatus Thermoplasmatota archaeon]
MVRRLAIGLAIAFVLLTPLAFVNPAFAAHKATYKSGVDVLDTEGWEGHFLWLRSPAFSYTGQVYWEFRADGDVVDALFMTWGEFRNFREGRPFDTITEPQLGVQEGVEGAFGLSTDSPYILVFRNPGNQSVTVTWELFAEIDWRRLGEPPSGPKLNLTFQQGSPPLAKDESWETTLQEPGYYLGYCRPHADMTALIEVVPAPSPAPQLAVAIRDYGFHPEMIRIPVGTPLLWTNHDGVEHSVQIGLLPEGIPDAPAPLPAPSTPFPWWLLVLIPAAGALAFVFVYRRRQED